jgi:hypothetical protein
LLAVVLPAGGARAEGVVEPKGKAQDRNRIFGAFSLAPIPNGLVPTGGASLRVYDRKTGKIKTVRPRERDELSAVASDPTGRKLVAAWKNDQELHVFDLKTGAHQSVPRPNYYGSVVSKLALAPDGKSVFVFNGGGGGGVEVYRVPLSPPGKEQLLFGGPLGELIWASPTEVITQCPVGRCPDQRLVHRALDTGVETVLSKAGGESARLSAVRVVRGSVPGDVVIFTNAEYGPRHHLLRFRARDGLVDVALPQEISNFVGHQLPPIEYSPSLEKVSLITRPGYELAIWMQSVAAPSPAPATLLATVPPLAQPLPGRSTPLVGFAARAQDKGLLIQWEDHLVLVGLDGKLRALDILGLTGGRPEWAGLSILVDGPEELWVGVESGRSRDFVRVSIAAAEAKAQPAQGVVVVPPPPSNEPSRTRNRPDSKAD